jgi:peptidoglycan/xylan/chitin deacetylase (PgdA/CDA1 family)
MARSEKRRWATEYLGTARRWPQHFLFPRSFFGRRVRTIPAVPSYFYHQVDPTHFRNICVHLREREFNTLVFSELLDGEVARNRSVLLSFDDGWSSVWSIAFPLAQRFGIKFTLFVVPDLIEDSLECRSTIDEEDPEVLIRRDRGKRHMLTWGEINAMFASGLVDIQSHTSHHGVVFTSDEVIGFADPEGGPFPLNGMSPCLWNQHSGDRPLLRLLPGTPIHNWAPALAARRRFIPDPGTVARCVEKAAKHVGGEQYPQEQWRKNFDSEFHNKRMDGRWETEEERRVRFRDDLRNAKDKIESHVPGTKMRVVAPPWALMHPDLADIARDTGHELIVLGYPFPEMKGPTSTPVYPRLYGDAIWTLIHGPIRGGFNWLRARKRAMGRVADGAIP